LGYWRQQPPSSINGKKFIVGRASDLVVKTASASASYKIDFPDDISSESSLHQKLFLQSLGYWWQKPPSSINGPKNSLLEEHQILLLKQHHSVSIIQD
jgi:hypothetical protein